MTNTFKICDFALKIYKILYNRRKHITYVFLISLVQVALVLWYLNVRKPADSLGNIEKGILLMHNDIKEIKSDIKVLAKNDSIQSDQLNHYPASLPLAMTDLTKVSSTYSERVDPITGQKRFHWGIDYEAPKGTPVFATATGLIEKTGDYDDGYGKVVRINHKNGYESLYAHLSDVDVKLDQEVKRGDMIGTVGNSGRSTGNHLHYEITYMEKHVNPNIFRSPLKLPTNSNFSYLESYQNFMTELYYQKLISTL